MRRARRGEGPRVKGALGVLVDGLHLVYSVEACLQVPLALADQICARHY